MPPSSVSKPLVVDPFANGVAPGPSDLFDAPSYMDSGFPAPSGVPVRPPLGFFNWLFNYCTNGIRYLCALGISTWDASETEYATGSIVRGPTTGYVYVCTGTPTTGLSPESDATNWSICAAPFAAAGAVWNRAISVWRNRKQQSRAIISHAGFVEGKVLKWHESWDATAPNKTTVTNGNWFGRWTYTIAGDPAGGTVTPSMPNSGPPMFSPGSNVNARTRGIYLLTNSIGTTDSAQEVEAPGQLILDADTCVTMQWDAIMLGGSPVGTAAEDTAGIITTSLQGASGTTLSNAPFGAWFDLTYNPSGPTYLHCRWQGASGGLGDFNTTMIIGNQRHRFRIEIYGANVSDDGSPRVLFYLDGTLLTNQVVDFTNATGTAVSAVATPFFRHDATQGSLWHHVGPVDFNANTWAGDVQI